MWLQHVEFTRAHTHTHTHTDLFQKLYRQDLLVASLFRNFLLAERIMRSYNCTPESHPPLPNTHHHPMWKAWDLALDHVMAQLPDIMAGKKEYEPAPFFSQQLSSFQVWLMNTGDSKAPPQQLPIVLQVRTVYIAGHTTYSSSCTLSFSLPSSLPPSLFLLTPSSSLWLSPSLSLSLSFSSVRPTDCRLWSCSDGFSISVPGQCTLPSPSASSRMS